MFPLHRLPQDLVVAILSELSLQDLASWSKTAHAPTLANSSIARSEDELNRHAGIMNRVWQNKFAQHFPHRYEVIKTFENNNDLNWKLYFQQVQNFEYRNFSKLRQKMYVAAKEQNLEFFKKLQLNFFDEDNKVDYRSIAIPEFFTSADIHNRTCLDWLLAAGREDIVHIIFQNIKNHLSSRPQLGRQEEIIQVIKSCHLQSIWNEGFALIKEKSRNNNELKKELKYIAIILNQTDYIREILDEGVAIEVLLDLFVTAIKEGRTEIVAQLNAYLINNFNDQTYLAKYRENFSKIAIENLRFDLLDYFMDADRIEAAMISTKIQLEDIANIESYLKNKFIVRMINENRLKIKHKHHEWNILEYAVFTYKIQVVKIILSTPGLTSLNIMSALDIAIQIGDLAIVQLLDAHIESQLSLTQPEKSEDLQALEDTASSDKDKRKPTTLHVAAVSGHVSVVQYLHERGGDLNVQDGCGNLPLHLAAQSNHLEVVKYLTTMSPQSLQIKNDQGITPFLAAVRDGSLAVVSYLFENHSINCTPKDINLAISNRASEVFKYLFPHINKYYQLPDSQIYAYLDSAIVKDCCNIVVFLLDTLGPKVGEDAKNNLIAKLIEHNSGDTVKELLSRQDFFTAEQKQELLRQATAQHRGKIVGLLLKNGIHLQAEELTNNIEDLSAKLVDLQGQDKSDEIPACEGTLMWLKDENDFRIHINYLKSLKKPAGFFTVLFHHESIYNQLFELYHKDQEWFLKRLAEELNNFTNVGLMEFCSCPFGPLMLDIGIIQDECWSRFDAYLASPDLSNYEKTSLGKLNEQLQNGINELLNFREKNSTLNNNRRNQDQLQQEFNQRVADLETTTQAITAIIDKTPYGRQLAVGIVGGVVTAIAITAVLVAVSIATAGLATPLALIAAAAVYMNVSTAVAGMLTGAAIGLGIGISGLATKQVLANNHSFFKMTPSQQNTYDNAQPILHYAEQAIAYSRP